MIRSLLIAVAMLATAAPARASSLADMAISSSQPGTVAAGAVFEHSYVVSNLGGVAGKYQTTDQFSTALDVVAVPSSCYVDTVLVRMRRQHAGVVCNGTLAPGESVTLTETLRAKATSWSGSVVVNRNRNVCLETSYEDNAAYWSVAVA